MVYQEDLREKQVIAVWLGSIPSEDALVDYLGKPFEDDVGFLLNQDALPEFAYSFEQQTNPPDLNKRKTARACTVPFDEQVAVAKLFSAFSHSSEWISEALAACHAQGIQYATIVVAFPNLRYRPELCRNQRAPLKFLGNFSWRAGLVSWKEEESKRLSTPGFPKLIQHEMGGWEGVVRLKSWTGFASDEELSGEFAPSKGCLPDGDLRLDVSSPTPSATKPSEEQSRSFAHFLEHETAIRDAVLEAVFKAYPEWRENYFGNKMSSDGGKTWEAGWDRPDLFPPENMPELHTLNDLRRLIRPETVHVMCTPKDGFVRIGFSFSCKWDEEHGLGVSTLKGTPIEVGSADISFMED